MANKFGFLYEDPSILTSASGSTPYAIYDNDESFATESVQVCQYVARKLGHPVMQLEFNSGSIYATFEESISEYSQHINNYNIKNWMFNQYGADTKLSGSQWGNNTGSNTMGTGSVNVVHPHMGTSHVLAEQYGEAVNVGGSTTVYSASIELLDGKQEYDLQNAFSASVAGTSLANKRIEIQRVFHGPRSAVSRFWDPFIGSFDQRMMLDQFGFASYAPSTTFVLRPIYYDVLRAQAIETSDYIRRSNYSFHLVNNNVKIFPRPDYADAGNKIWFSYYIRDEITESKEYTQNKVTDPSNVPYKFITYSEINASGRQWIRKMTLALAKELLGIIRSKYASLPLPNGEVAMDGDALKSEGREEKTQLQEELKEFLESVSLSERARAESEQAESQQSILNKAPLEIFLG